VGITLGGYMLLVNEIFGPTIQGEGKTLGKPVVFLRLGGCNLQCIWCDTPYTWNWIGSKWKHKEKFDPKEELTRSEIHEVLDRLREIGSTVKALVISGGEPMLQQKYLIPLIKELKAEGWWVEVETNGTIAPLPEFLELVDQINCSPKLANSGSDNTLAKRLKPLVLKKLAESDKVYFKFVVASVDDVTEIYQILRALYVKQSHVYLMPEGRTKDEQIMNQGLVERLADNLGFKFSPREHILQFGAKRAV